MNEWYKLFTDNNEDNKCDNRTEKDEDYYWEVIRKNSEETGINIMDYMK